MEYTYLGRSGLAVSRAALGTMNFGAGAGAEGCCDESEARQIVDEFLDAGGNLIDTADLYNGGESEKIVGRAIANRRDQVILATKGGGPRGRGPNSTGLSRVHLTLALDASLRRLGTDHVDLYQCHLWDGATPIEETMSTLDGFVRAGKVRYLGCSNFTVAQIVESQWASERLGGSGFVSLQPHYSLLARDIEAEILPACARQGLGAITYGPLASGMLAGRYRPGVTPEPGSRMDQWLHHDHPAATRWAEAILTERNFEIADAVARVAAELGATPAAVAIAWVCRRPGVSSVILGPRDREQLRANLDGVELLLPAALRERLDTVSAPANRPVTGVPIEVSAGA